jgi:hypothetical protein
MRERHAYPSLLLCAPSGADPSGLSGERRRAASLLSKRTQYDG